MRPTCLAVPVAVLLTCVAAAEKDRGRVEGVVTYTGPIPRPVPVEEAGTVRHLVEVHPRTRGLRDAVVWLEGVPARNGAKPPGQAAVMDQQNFFFVPHVLAVEAGRAVEFLNSDGANHGVLAASLEPKNSFNVVTPPGGSYTHRFHPTRRPVRIGCPLHAGMGAWVFVFEHPYFAVTGADGSFRLPAAPPGDYTLAVQHADGGVLQRQPVTVRAGGATRVAVRLGDGERKGKAE